MLSSFGWEIRKNVSEIAGQVGAVDSGKSGMAAAGYHVSTASDNDFILLVPVVMPVIGVLLALVMRSLVAPLYLVLNVALLLGAFFGIALIVYMIVGGQSGLNFVLPFLMFVFLMALGRIIIFLR